MRSGLFFFLLFLLFSFLYIGSYGLIDWDEVIYAEASRQMLLSGNYLNVYINDQPFAEKPPFFFWMMNFSYALFGVNEIGARFPSILAGCLLFTALFFAGKRMLSARFGVLWAVISGFAFFPGILTRSAVIDQTFNFFIALSCLGFCFFEDRLQARKRGNQWKILTGIALLMGMGVLTKGPLGGAVPVFVYGIYKLFRRTPSFSFGQFFYCGILSLFVVALWPTFNFLFYGDRFLIKFAEFQGLLFSKSLEGHEGPFYYHFPVLLAGLLPWTGFLFLCPVRKLFSESSSIQIFAYFSVIWIGMILLIMSLVKTKLPHYSSPAYVPLAFFAAYGAEMYFSRRKIQFGFIYKILILLSFVFLPIFLLILPTALESGLQSNGFSPVHFDLPWFYGISGVSLLCCLTGFYFWLRRNFILTFFSVICGLLFFASVLYGRVLPEYDRVFQKPIIEKVDTYQKAGGRIMFFDALFFSPFFYNNAKVNVVGSYKFKGEEEVLNQKNSEDIYIIVAKDAEEKFQDRYPEIPRIDSDELFSVYKKPAE